LDNVASPQDHPSAVGTITVKHQDTVIASCSVVAASACSATVQAGALAAGTYSLEVMFTPAGSTFAPSSMQLLSLTVQQGTPLATSCVAGSQGFAFAGASNYNLC